MTADSGMENYRKLISECEKLDEQGFYRKSIDRLTEEIEANSSVSQLFFQRGSRYEELGELSLALSDYSESIKIDPTTADFFVYRGNLYGNLGRDVEAIGDYEAAIKLDPHSPSPHQFLSLLYSLIGRSSSAIKHADIALELDSRDAMSYYCAAFSRMKVGDYPYAIEKLLIAVELEKESANYWSTLGRCYLKTKELERSKSCYESAMKIEPNALYHIKIAKIALYKEDSEIALQQLIATKKFELSDDENRLINEYTKRARKLKNKD